MTLFAEAVAEARPHMMLDDAGAATLWHLARTAPREGAFAELGVYRGGSALLMRRAAPHRMLHLFDTFAGHPAVHSRWDDVAAQPVGRFADTQLQTVLDLVGPPVQAHSGPFSLVACTPPPWLEPLAFVHLDADLYEPTAAALRICWPLLVPGGRILLHDWVTVDCPGIRQAVREFCAQGFQGALGGTLESLETNQAVLWKCAA